MITIKELKEKRATALEKMNEEVRSAEFDSTKVSSIEEEIRSIDSQIAAIQKFDGTKGVETPMNENVTEELRSVLTTSVGAEAIPTTLSDRVIAKLQEKYNLFGEIPTIEGQGTIDVLTESAPKEGQILEELEEVTFESEGFTKKTLNLKRVATGIQFSKNFILNSALDEGYFLNKLVQRIGDKISYNLVNGMGGANNFEGLVMLENEVETAVKGLLTIDDVNKAINTLHPDVLAGAKIVVSRPTYIEMAQWKDGNGDFYLTREKNAQEGFVYKILGLPVEINNAVDTIAEGKRALYIVNPALWNKRIAQGVTVEKISDRETASKGIDSFIADLYTDIKIVDEQQAIALKVKAE